MILLSLTHVLVFCSVLHAEPGQAVRGASVAIVAPSARDRDLGASPAKLTPRPARVPPLAKKISRGFSRHPRPWHPPASRPNVHGTGLGRFTLVKNLLQLTRALSPPDGEVTAPDDSEDGDSDSPGEALRRDGRTLEFLAASLVPEVELLSLPPRCGPHTPSARAQRCSRVIALCRFLC
ncbi:hypothetical protein ACYOEI_28200 [Singulisphaera rosea]